MRRGTGAFARVNQSFWVHHRHIFGFDCPPAPAPAPRPSSSGKKIECFPDTFRTRQVSVLCYDSIFTQFLRKTTFFYYVLLKYFWPQAAQTSYRQSWNQRYPRKSLLPLSNIECPSASFRLYRRKSAPPTMLLPPSGKTVLALCARVPFH